MLRGRRRAIHCEDRIAAGQTRSLARAPTRKSAELHGRRAGPGLAKTLGMLTTLAQLPRLLVALVALTAAPPSGGGGEGGKDRPPRPPREAIEACEDLDAGDACGFLGRDGDTVEGTCWQPDASKPLACRPAHPRR